MERGRNRRKDIRKKQQSNRVREGREERRDRRWRAIPIRAARSGRGAAARFDLLSYAIASKSAGWKRFPERKICVNIV